MDSMAFNKGQHVGKAKKKQVKDELDRLNQAEKKKRRLEKALATSAAIISELEKKKQKKKEEQQRLDEEGAAIAEAVALHVLLGEDSNDSCKVVIDDNGLKTWNCNHNLDLFMAGKRACFPHLDGGTWSVTAENDEWSFSSGSFEKNVYEPLYEEAGWAADIFLWRNKRCSGIALGAGTALWLFFELLEYHLITLVCHLLIVSLASLFLWSNASVFIHKSPLHIPHIAIPEECVVEIASALRIEINRAFVVLRDIGTGRDLKKFLSVIGGLWFISVIGNWFNFLTLFYLGFVSLFTLPLLYEKYEDQVDAFGEKAMIEIKKQYAVFDAKVLRQIPIAGLKKD